MLYKCNVPKIKRHYLSVSIYFSRRTGVDNDSLICLTIQMHLNYYSVQVVRLMRIILKGSHFI